MSVMLAEESFSEAVYIQERSEKRETRTEQPETKIEETGENSESEILAPRSLVPAPYLKRPDTEH